jgi:hypothetical protein
VTAVLALAVAGVIVALVTSRDEATLPASSPEGTVQRYLRALEQKDYRGAYAYLNASAQRQCTIEQFIRATSYRELKDAEMILEDTQLLDDSAIVTARVTAFDPSNVFDPSEYSYTETFDLTREGGLWRLKWQNYQCPPSF